MIEETRLARFGECKVRREEMYSMGLSKSTRSLLPRPNLSFPSNILDPILHLCGLHSSGSEVKCARRLSAVRLPSLKNNHPGCIRSRGESPVHGLEVRQGCGCQEEVVLDLHPLDLVGCGHAPDIFRFSGIHGRVPCQLNAGIIIMKRRQSIFIFR